MPKKEDPNNPGKKNYRLCADLRKLNLAIKEISYPLPTFNEIMDSFSSKEINYISTCDFKQGFLQIPIEEKSRDYLSCEFQYEKFRFKKLPFGLTSSSHVFMNIISDILGSKILGHYAQCYVDDLLVFSDTWEHHKQHLTAIFDKLRVSGLMMNPAKCNFAVEKCLFLGFYISKKGIEVDPEKIKVISEYKPCENAAMLRSWLGYCSFYRRFIKNYAQITSPLTKLLCKDAKFVWSKDVNDAFLTIKKAMTQTPVLALPNLNREFNLYTDASYSGVGYSLTQVGTDGLEHAIHFGGRGLSRCEKNWSVTDIEGLALVTALAELHSTLANAKIHVYTDHISLTYLRQMRTSCQGRLLRFALRIAPYNLEIHYKEGRTNKVADFLSRMPWPDHVPAPPDNTVLSSEINIERITDVRDETVATQTDETVATQTAETVVTTVDADVKTDETQPTTLSKDCCEAVGKISAIKQKDTKPKDDVAEDQVDPPTQVVEVFLHTFSREELKLKQEQCPELGPIINFVRNSDLHMDAKQARFLSSKSSRYYLDNDILYHIPYDSRSIHKDILLGKQLCVPLSLRADLLESKHKLAGHAGGRRLYLSLLTSFYWQSMFTDAKAYATSCTVCQQNKMSTQTHKVPLKSIKNEHLFNVWSMDVLKMPKSHQGNSLALVCVENFSLWPEITPLANETAPEIANALVNTIFVRHGIPQQLLSDRGSNFTSKLLNKVCQLLKVKRLLTATYRPQSDPAEAQNKMILQTLRCMAENEDANWEDNLPAVLLAHRSTPSPTRADMSPYKLLYARDMPTPDEVQFENLRDTQMSTASKEFLSNLVEKLQLAHKLAKAQIKQTQEENKKFYDRDAKAVIYPPGTKVWLRREKVDQGRSPKLFKRYNGPFFITTKIGENTYQLRECNTNQLLKAPVNADRLKLVIDRTDKLSYSKRAAVQESDDEDILTDDPADKEVTQTDTNPRTTLTKVDRQLHMSTNSFDR